MPQKPSKRPKTYCQIRQNTIKSQTRSKNNLARNTYDQNDDAKSSKRCKTNGGQTTKQNDTAKSGKTQRG